MSGAFKCPACAHKFSTVVDSRATHKGVRRRRVCRACNGKWSTIEVDVKQTNEPFARDLALAKAIRRLVATT